MTPHLNVTNTAKSPEPFKKPPRGPCRSNWLPLSSVITPRLNFDKTKRALAHALPEHLLAPPRQGETPLSRASSLSEHEVGAAL